jgi:CspA family cold shock protein
MPTRGKVKWFDPKKGYGFILGPDGQDVFVHYSQIQGDGFRSLKDGEDVDYELIQGDKGWQAQTVLRAMIEEASQGLNASGNLLHPGDAQGQQNTRASGNTGRIAGPGSDETL